MEHGKLCITFALAVLARFDRRVLLVAALYDKGSLNFPS
jgi:hypothetical protein